MQLHSTGFEMAQHSLDPPLDRRMVCTVARDEFLDNGPQRNGRKLCVRYAHGKQLSAIRSHLVTSIDRDSRDSKRRLPLALDRQSHAEHAEMQRFKDINAKAEALEIRDKLRIADKNGSFSDRYWKLVDLTSSQEKSAILTVRDAAKRQRGGG